MSDAAGQFARTVVLAAHGAGDGSIANAEVRALAAALSNRMPGASVVTAFELGTPGYHEVLDQLSARAAAAVRRVFRVSPQTPRRVTVVPVMTSRGYFSGQRLPSGLRANRTASEFDIEICSPLGLHPRVVASLVDGAVRLVRAGAEERQTLVLAVGHGTRRDARSSEATEALARALRDALPGVPVATGFLDQEPLLEMAAGRLVGPTDGCAPPRLVVVPLLFGGGPHLEQDLGCRLAGVAAEVIVAPALADQPELLSALEEWSR